VNPPDKNQSTSYEELESDSVAVLILSNSNSLLLEPSKTTNVLLEIAKVASVNSVNRNSNILCVILFV
jgi:hypothetical protein